MTIDAAKVAIQSEWEHEKDPDLIIAQSEAHLLIAESAGELLLEQNIEIGFEELVAAELNEEEEEKEYTEDQKKQFGEWKKMVVDHIALAAELAASVSQPWLVCNIAIYLWNNYLVVLRDTAFMTKIYQNSIETFKKCYGALSGIIPSGAFTTESIDYAVASKADILANLAWYYAKMEEAKGNTTDAVKVCDEMLQKQLLPHLRKNFDALKARISKSVAAGGKASAPAAGAKGGKDKKPPVPAAKGEEKKGGEAVSAEVIAYIELIMATKEKTQATDLLKKAIESMNNWSVDKTDEEDLELYAEQWTRLGQLAFKQETAAQMKTALICAENACKIAGEPVVKIKGIPEKRLRWYALAKCLYGDVLNHLVDPKRQEKGK